MGIVRYAVAAGIGYYAGQPEGRRQLTKLRRQAAEFARGPEVKRVRERGWDLVGDGALATRNLAAKARSKASSGGRHQGDDAAATTQETRRRVLPGLSSWRRPRPDSAATAAEGTDPTEAGAATGFNGTTVAEDSKAALMGLSTPPSAADTRPAGQPEDRP